MKNKQMHKITNVDTSKFNKGDTLYLDINTGKFVTRKKDRIDLIIAILFMLSHLIMVNNLEDNLNNFIYQEMTVLMALAGWFFLGRFLWFKFKANNYE